ncbi:bifunctional aldolase/short-chain dehydrogenase [Undibacter mobilis]|uniref:Bifunctional aldolase/short-chain dehydrogenase n=1 Tax=Undibacter mobilis TaxID=2292256 RepID=A0A371B6D9_9BRAD|nr:bifunctional aldolase/short-chain dehydrogenase [Undibacter mobilis]RDV03124.1 bifunctional aldolase/short-chain dehydrogenase [Undibacter mobilis]
MENLWSDEAARAAVTKYAAQGVNEDLALRTYTTRLLGGEPRLVQHGGGNTSVKTKVTDSLGRKVDVLCVKGSGWDMGIIEPPGLPAVKLTPLLELAALDALSDEDMVNLQRTNLIDAGSPTPSVETLLHAFIPHKFVDHTHANATLSLCDRPDGMALCRKVFGPKVPVIDFVPPGFALAKKAKETFNAHPDCIGLMLHKHGIFSFGATAREAYERMIGLVSLAEQELAKGADRKLVQVKLPASLASVGDVAPILRGLLASPIDKDEGRFARVILEHRATPAVLDYVNGAELARYSQLGPVTPDHVIRTKPKPLILPAPETGKLEDFATAARDAVNKFRAGYRAYFEQHNAKANPKKKPLDDTPRVALVPGLGLFGIGPTAKDAAVTADIAETCAAVVLDAERTGRFETIDEAAQFDMEYWSLEQAKLGKTQPKALQGQVAIVTGGAGTIGKATAAALKREGAEVVLLDLNEEQVKATAKSLGALGLACDVTDRASVDAAFKAVATTFGGVDILVANAGAAWQGRIGEVDDAVLRKSFELNFFGAQNVAQAAVKLMLTQATGGTLLFNVSKQAVNPGPNFGPYGLPKAAAMALMRQYAIDYGADGITANAVNADRIRSGLLTDDMVKARSTARGVSERDYMSGNLLGREVRAEDVAEAFVSLALARKTTGAVLTVDGGNVAAALR